MDLQKVIQRCLKGNRRAQFDLYQYCFDNLMLTCNRFTSNRDDALSLLNTGFLKILNNLDKYDTSQSFNPWISTIMVRTAIDEHRSSKTYKLGTVLYDSDGALEQASNYDEMEDVVSKMQVEEIKKLIFELPDNERIVFTLYEMEGYKHHEIAEQLGVSERSTKRYLKSAKLLLQRGLIGERNIESLTS
ncbi:MAG: RNA polymerase sigma factor [Flavobacteriia bacterium]|nr:RNA polymerase sigma factor [Flavobacteriia bacterium]